MFKYSESWGDKPNLVEVTPTCVFVRRSFEQIEQEDGEEPTGATGWRYEEARMTHGEYAAYVQQGADNRADMLEEAIVELAEILGGE